MKWGRLVRVACVVVIVAAAVALIAHRSTKTLSQQLVSVADLHGYYGGAEGSKWTNYPNAVTPAHDCTYRFMEPATVTQMASAKTVDIFNHDLPLYQEKIATYSSATKAFEGVVAILTRCLGRTTQGQPLVPVEHVGRLTLPHYGDASAGFTLGFTVAAKTYVIQLLIVRKGSEVAAIEVEQLSAPGDYSAHNVRQLTFLAVRAVAKLS
jgi:hypothetical protein